jgi:hypothetical protein
MSEAPLEPQEIEKIKTFISKLSKELSHIFERQEPDLDQLFPQYVPFDQNKEPQDAPGLDEKGG